MQQAARSPGRPLGTGKNDDCFLDQIADLMIAHPEWRPRSAMTLIVNAQPECYRDAVLRRLQRKWKNDQARFLNAARERAAARSVKPANNRDEFGFFMTPAYQRSLVAAAPMLQSLTLGTQHLERWGGLAQQAPFSPAILAFAENHRFSHLTKWAALAKVIETPGIRAALALLDSTHHQALFRADRGL